MQGFARSIGWTDNKMNPIGLSSNLAVRLWTPTWSLSALFEVSLREQSLEGQVGGILTSVVGKWGGAASWFVFTSMLTRFFKNGRHTKKL